MTFALTIALLCFPFSTKVTAQDECPQGCIHTKAYAVLNESDSRFVPYEFERRPVGNDDILIEILYSGICHSDIHTANGDWGNPYYPCVPGHEIVGKVTKTGKDVTRFKVGDIAGVGCMINSCGKCHYCQTGEEQFCTAPGGAVYTYDSPEGDSHTKGGYATNIVVRESFAIQIPADAPLDKVAPLLCAGITTYSPLKKNRVKPGDKVAVAGFGGLGHMALQYAVSMGAEVTVFDITDDKREAALQMGASHYVNTTREVEMEGMDNTFSLIVSTIPVSFEVERYLWMLCIDGTMVLLGVPAWKDWPSLHLGMMGWRKNIYRSLIGGIRETQEMLDYSVKQGIYAQVKTIPIQSLNEAYQDVLDGRVQFRYVIDMSSLK